MTYLLIVQYSSYIELPAIPYVVGLSGVYKHIHIIEQ